MRSDELRVLFVGGSDLHSPDEKQFFEFARGLVARGQAALMMLREGAPDYGRQEREELPEGLSLHSYRLLGRWPRRADLAAVRRFQPDLIHALYPRGTVLAASAAFSRATAAPIFVHIGDDEWGLLGGAPERSFSERLEALGRRIVGRVHPWVWPYSTPRWLRFAGRHALAFDALTPALADEVGRRFGRDCAVVLPAFELPEGTESGLDPAVAGAFDGAPAALYTGAIGAVHEPDIRLGLRALAEVQRRGTEVAFVHAGPTDARRDPLKLAQQEGLAPGSAHALGYIPMAKLTPLLRRAALLLQPGAPSEFNRLRLPSKLQAYLASGTPTVTFAVGFGELLEDRVEVLKTYTADHSELADRIVELLTNEELRRRLSQSAPLAARRLFDPKANVEALEAHYRKALGARQAPLGPRVPRR